MVPLALPSAPRGRHSPAGWARTLPGPQSAATPSPGDWSTEKSPLESHCSGAGWEDNEWKNNFLPSLHMARQHPHPNLIQWARSHTSSEGRRRRQFGSKWFRRSTWMARLMLRWWRTLPTFRDRRSSWGYAVRYSFLRACNYTKVTKYRGPAYCDTGFTKLQGKRRTWSGIHCRLKALYRVNRK